MLKIRHFSKLYDNKPAVDDLSLEVNAGDIYAFIGHNGAGKTTTIKACCGILQFEQGDIFVNGLSVKDSPIECKKQMAYIPDNPELYEYLSGIKYLNFVADIYGVGKAERTERIAKYADAFGLTEDLAQLMPDEIAKYDDKPSPAVILIPGKGGSLGVAQKALQSAVERAVGADIS